MRVDIQQHEQIYYMITEIHYEIIRVRVLGMKGLKSYRASSHSACEKFHTEITIKKLIKGHVEETN